MGVPRRRAQPRQDPHPPDRRHAAPRPPPDPAGAAPAPAPTAARDTRTRTAPTQFRNSPRAVKKYSRGRQPQPVQDRGGRPRLLHAAEGLTGERFVVFGEAAVARLPQPLGPQQVRALGPPAPGERPGEQPASSPATPDRASTRAAGSRPTPATSTAAAAYRRSGWPQNLGPSNVRSRARSASRLRPPHSRGANMASVSVEIHRPLRRSKSRAAPDRWSVVVRTPCRNRAAHPCSSRTSEFGIECSSPMVASTSHAIENIGADEHVLHREAHRRSASSASS